MTSGDKRRPGSGRDFSPLFRAAARSPYVRYFAPVDERTSRWSSVLLARYADVYFRRCVTAESGIIASSLWIWPGMPLWLQVPLGLLGAAWTWIACMAAIALLDQGKSLWKALLGRK